MSDQITWADIDRWERGPSYSGCQDCGEEFQQTPENEKFCWSCLGKFYAEVHNGDQD